MQKTTTLKDFRVFLLRTFLSVFVLGISLQVSMAQSLGDRKASMKANPNKQVVTLSPAEAAAAKQQAKLAMSQAVQMPATDVPELNQAIMQTQGANPAFGKASQNFRLTNPATTPTSNIVEDVCTYTGALVTGDQTFSARPFRGGVPSSCASTPACGTPLGGTFFYDTYTITNLTCAPQCVSVSYFAGPSTPAGDIFVTAYLGTFNPASVCTNRIADGGSSSISTAGAPGATVTFSFNLAANATVVLVANTAFAGSTCPSYTITVTGLTCTPPPPCTPITSAVLSQVQIPAAPVNLINETFTTAIPLPAGWVQQNLSSPLGLTNWFQGNNGVFPGNTPPGYIAANFNNTTGNNIISNWLFAPSVLLKNGDTIKFWTRTVGAPFFPDRLQVRLNTTNTGTNAGGTNTSVGDFTTLLLDINPTYTTSGYPSAWTQYRIGLSGLPAGGVNGRFAFRYFVEGGGPAGANSDYIGIDDVVYQTIVTANPNTCVGSNVNLKVDITGGTPGATYNMVLNANPPGGPAGNFAVNNYTSGNNILVSPVVNTTYSIVSIVDANNPCCISTNNSGTPLVVVAPGPVPAVAITANPNPPLCAGDPTLLTVVSGIPLTNWFLTRSVSQTVVPLTSVACTVGPNTWWRVYDLAAYPLVGPFTITNAQFRVEQANAAQNVTVQLYTQTGGAFPAGTRTPIPGGNVVVAVPNGTNLNITANFAVPPVVPNNSVIVVAVTVPTAGWWIGANPGGQTDPSYLSAAACGAPNPTNLATLGFPNDHIILNLNGTTGGASGPLPPGSTVLWSPATGLSNPTSNPVAASPSVTRQYTALVTLPGGCQTVANINIPVNPLPAVVTQPVDVTVCQGGNATFSVTGTGAGITYQWQVSTTGVGGPYANVANGGVYSGVTTPTLTITGATNAMNGYFYRCVISGTCPPAANSNGARLTVNALPTITINPSGTICGGVAGINGVALTASGANSYVWSPLTGLYTNATATTAYTGTNLATVYAAPTVNTIYTVNGTNTTTGCVGSASVRVVFTPPPPTVTPASVTMCLGDPAVKLKAASATTTSVSFSSGAISVPVPDNNPAGATSTINVSGIPAACNVSAMAVTWNMTHTWDGDMVFVIKAPNNNILNLDYYISATGGAGATAGFVNTKISSTGVAALSTGAPAYTGTFRADAVTATIAPFGPPGPTGYAPTGNTWTQLYSVPNGTYTLAMYDGGAADLGTLTSWSIDLTYVCGVITSAATWSPNGGLFLDAAATVPYDGREIDSVWTRPTPSGVYNYQVTVKSAGYPVYQTFTNPAPITIPNVGTGTPYPSNLVVSGLRTTGASVDSVKINGMSHTWSSDIAILLQSPNAPVQNTVLMAGVGGANVLTNVTYTFVDGAPALGAGVNPTGQYRPTSVGAAHNFPAPGPGAFSTANPLSAFTGNMNGTWKLFVVDEVGGDQGQIAGGYSITFKYPGVGCTSPPRIVPVTVNDKAVVTTQPVDRTICTDKSTTFSVVATGSAPISYRWQVSTDNANTFNNISDNLIYSGTTTATLTITAPPVSYSGYFYRCVVQSALPCTATNSFWAKLTVNPLPTVVISAAPYVRLFPGLITTISSSVSPFAAATYTWRRDGVIISGASSATLSVDVDGQGEYQLTVTDVNGCTNSSNKISILDSVSANCFLYPNPSNGKFQVRYHSVANNVLPRTVTITDSKGSRVLTQQFTIVAPYARMDVDLRPFGKGVYWVEIGDRNGSRLVVCRAVVD